VKPLNFCASCGAVLDDLDREGGAPCSSCGRVWYRNPAPTVGCAIVRDGRALVAVRAFEPHRGKVDVPGGFLHVAEQPIEGLKREVTEELGVEIDVAHEDLLQAVAHRYEDGGEWLVSLGYRARLTAGEPTPNDDVAEVRWVVTSELDGLDWAWPHDLVLVRRALEHG
jgi:ADP-ribose pyrophosphatase YjhB (NUDIX family)